MDIPNATVDQLAKSNLSQYQWRVLLAIILTNGIPTSFYDFQDLTYIPAQHIARTISSLISRHIITKIQNESTTTNSYIINTNYSIWRKSTKLQPIPKGTRCSRCGNKTDLERHHIAYRSDGGEDDESNISVLCVACHDYQHAIESVEASLAKEKQPDRIMVLQRRKDNLIKENTPELIISRGYKPYWFVDNTQMPRRIRGL